MRSSDMSTGGVITSLTGSCDAAVGGGSGGG